MTARTVKHSPALCAVLHRENQALESLLTDVLGDFLFLVGTLAFLELDDFLDDTNSIA